MTSTGSSRSTTGTGTPPATRCSCTSPASLRAATARRGTVARLGGDEFVVVVQDLDGPRAVFEVAAAIHAGLREPVRVARRRLNVAASIGIALADPDSTEGGAPGLLAAADAALYRAKGAGRGRTEVYDASMSMGSPSDLHRELAAAIAEDQLVVHYQPIVDLADSRVVGYEALVRWEHPQRGLLLPGSFLSLIQEAGMSVAARSAGGPAGRRVRRLHPRPDPLGVGQRVRRQASPLLPKK